MEAPCLLGYGASIAQMYSQNFVFCLPCSSCQLDAIVGWSNIALEFTEEGSNPWWKKHNWHWNRLDIFQCRVQEMTAKKSVICAECLANLIYKRANFKEKFRSSSTHIVSRTCCVHIITLGVYGDNHHPESGFMCWAQLNWQWRTY
jgi:hypothetical protein